MARKVGATGGSSPLTRTETQQSLLLNSNHQTGGASTSQKRPASPDYKKRDDRPPVDYGPPHKRPRPLSPIRDRDRERWEPPPRRRSPGWDRDRDGPPPRRTDRDREEEKGVVLPPVISWFVGQLPAPSAFDG
jgi:cleavage stimulation factor subunit 3